ncbi:hypothetical protein BGZ94_009316, partial [Podila epigama]
MAPTQFKVVIVGGGIAGLALGVMLERAGIDYIILEAAPEVRPLGAIVYLGPPLMRAMEQLGLMDDLVRNSTIMTGVTLMNHRLVNVCRFGVDYAEERYGHPPLTIVRPKLYDILLSRIPAYKILFGKRVTSSSENHEGITVRCEDGSSHHGSILVGADGSASPVRERLYQDIRRGTAPATSKGHKKTLHRSDYAPPKVEQQCIVGITEPLSVETYPALASKTCELIMVMPKEADCMDAKQPVPDNTVAQERTSTESRFNGPISKPQHQQPQHHHRHHHRHHSADFDSYANILSSSSSGHLEPDAFSDHYSSAWHMGNMRHDDDIYSTESMQEYNTLHSSMNYPHPSQRTRETAQPLSPSHYHATPTSTAAPTLDHRTTLNTKTTSSNVSGGSTKASDIVQQPIIIHPMREQTAEKSWRHLDEKFSLDESILSQVSPFGGTLGDMVKVTTPKMVSSVYIEEKFFHTWYHGRTMLIGDACHT